MDISTIPGSPKPPTNGDFEQTLKDFQLMLHYALAEGLLMDDKTRETVAAAQSAPGVPNFPALMAAHAALSKVVSPATPLSLEATRPAPGPMGSLRRPPLIMWMIIIALVAAIGFVVTNIFSGSPTVEKANWCFAAALGAVFYVLFTAHGYVKDRTFDPRYNAVYLIRFVLGVLSGLILAIVLERFMKSSPNNTVSNLGPSVIALLGGFSTEAVYQVLQRFVDMLLAAVRGDDSDAAKTKASQAAQKELLALADDPSMSPDLKSKAIAAAKKVAA